MRHLSASAPRAGRGPCGPPAPARRAAPAAPQAASGARRATRVCPQSHQGLSSDPLRALRGCPVASPRTSLRFVRFPNLSPRTGSCAPQVLCSRSACGEKQQKFGARLPWPGSTTFIAYLNVFPPTEHGDPLARPSPNSNSLNPNKKSRDPVAKY